MFSRIINQFVSRTPLARLGRAAAHPTGAMLRPGGSGPSHRQLARAADVQPGAVRTLLNGGDLRTLYPREQVQMRDYLHGALRSPATPASARPLLAHHAERLAVAMDPGQHARRLASVRLRDGDRNAVALLGKVDTLVAQMGHRTLELRIARLESHPARSQAIYADITGKHAEALRLLGIASDRAQSPAVGARAGRALDALDGAMREAQNYLPRARRR